jgi:hypothetical protein
MAEAEHEVGFLSRWSRRKAQARTGNELAEAEAPNPALPAPTPEAPATSDVTSETSAPASECSPDGEPMTAGDATPEPLPTLADVAKLTSDSDFTRFLAPNVEAGVKNAALKKLFADPHFNVMDGLDVYIDDYSVPSPLPQHLLLKMAQAKFLGLVKEKTEEVLAHLSDLPPDDAGDAVPVQAAPDAPAADSIAHHEDADLQLQPHDDAGRAGTPPGSGQDAGREH